MLQPVLQPTLTGVQAVQAAAEGPGPGPGPGVAGPASAEAEHRPRGVVASPSCQQRNRIQGVRCFNDSLTRKWEQQGEVHEHKHAQDARRATGSGYATASLLACVFRLAIPTSVSDGPYNTLFQRSPAREVWRRKQQLLEGGDHWTAHAVPPPVQPVALYFTVSV